MKKILAILLALMLVLVNAAALAGGTPEDNNPDEEPLGSNTADWVSAAVTFKPTADGAIKVYDSSDTTILPDETLNFTSTPDAGNPTTDNITITGYHAENASGTIEITFPSVNKVGVYKYTIAENAGDSMGVIYSTGSISLSVLVVYDYDNKCLKVETIGVTKNADGKKETTLTNKYEVGDLTIEKEVTGNLGDHDQYFDVDVTFTTTANYYVRSDITVSGGTDTTANNKTIGKNWTGDKTYSFKIKHGEKVTFANVPKDVTYKIEEAAAHAETDANGSDSSKGYAVSYDAYKESTITASALESKITNDKSKTIDTGIVLETLPFVLLMGIALAGVAVLSVRRREDY